jgi:hypothetical protein
MATLIESHEGSVRSASTSLVPQGAEASVIRLRRADCLVFHRLDRVEHARREAAGAAWLDEFRPLEMLMNLPVGIPVPRSSLGAALRPEVRLLPHGAAVSDRRSVKRLAVQPLKIDLVVVRAPGWRSGMDLASQFAPFCRRAMVLERVPHNLDELLMEADFFGIGVFVPRRGGAQMLVAPAEYRALRFTTAAWRFAEQVYRAVFEKRPA